MSLGVGKLIIAQAQVGKYYNGGFYMGNHTIGSDTYRIIVRPNANVLTRAISPISIWSNTSVWSPYSPFYYDHISSSTSVSSAGTSSDDGWLNSAQYSNGDGSYMDTGNLFWKYVPGVANFYWWAHTGGQIPGQPPGYGLVSGVAGNRKQVWVGRTINGYDDWYWPSKDELTLVTNNRNKLPVGEDFDNSETYSSSTHTGTGAHWILDPSVSTLSAVTVSRSQYQLVPLFHVRAVRRELI